VPEDIFRYHAISFGGSDAGRLRRHVTVVKALHDLFHSAGLYPVMNGPFQCLSHVNSILHRRRPADLLIDGDNCDKFCIDVTVVSPLSDAKTTASQGKTCGLLAAVAVKDKISKHKGSCESAGKGFMSFAVDVCGQADSAA
jgi:hypothetical protein